MLPERSGRSVAQALQTLKAIKIPLPVKIGASILLIVLVLLKVDLALAVQVIATVNPLILLSALFVAVGAWLINTRKWQVLLQLEAAPLPYFVLLRLSFIGIFYNLVLPGQIGGEVIKSIRLAGLGLSAVTSAVSVAADRATGLLAILSLGVVGILTAPPQALDGLQLVPWLVALTVALAAATAMLVTGRGFGLLTTAGKAFKLSATWLARLPIRRHNLASLAMPLLLSVLFQLAAISSNWLAALALDIHVGFLEMMWIVAVVSVVQALPISIAGIGVREGALVYLLQLQGIDAARALAFSLLIFATQLFLALIGGLLQLQGLRGVKA